ncbi:hypothetical protein, partial [Sinomicrobium weinanense]
MNRFLLFSFLFYAFSPVHAQEKTQNIEIRYGNVFKNDEREIPTDIIGHDKNGYYLLYSGGRFG